MIADQIDYKVFCAGNKQPLVDLFEIQRKDRRQIYSFNSNASIIREKDRSNERREEENKIYVYSSLIKDRARRNHRLLVLLLLVLNDTCAFFDHFSCLSRLVLWRSIVDLSEKKARTHNYLARLVCSQNSTISSVVIRNSILNLTPARYLYGMLSIHCSRTKITALSITRC